MSDVSVKVSKETYEAVREIAERSGRSIKDVIEDAVKAYARGATQDHVEKELTEFKHALIISKFKTKCSLCKSTVDEGELIMWVRYRFADGTQNSKVICYSCLMKERTLAKVFLKKRELQRTIRGLKALAEEYAERVERLKAELGRLEAERELHNLVTLLKQLALSASSPEYAQLMELGLRVEELEKKIKSLVSKQSILVVEKKAIKKKD